MKVISLNMNGIRAAARKGCFEWLAEQDADFVCVQETKAQMAALEGEVFVQRVITVTFLMLKKKGIAGLVSIQNMFPRNIFLSVIFNNFEDIGKRR